MEGKKSFVLYADVKTTLDELTDEQAGKLFKTVLDYVNDENPEIDDAFVRLAFAPIRQQLKRDLDKWLKRSVINSKNGKKGGRPKESEKSESVNLQAKKADNVNVIVNDNDNVIVIENETIILKEGRKLKFAQSLNPFLVTYKKAELKEFLEYWTEHNDNGKKLRFEMSKNQPFNLSRRLGTWHRKNNDGTITKPGATKKRGAGVDPEYLDELNERINGGQ